MKIASTVAWGVAWILTSPFWLLYRVGEEARYRFGSWRMIHPNPLGLHTGQWVRGFRVEEIDQKWDTEEGADVFKYWLVKRKR